MLLRLYDRRLIAPLRLASGMGVAIAALRRGLRLSLIKAGTDSPNQKQVLSPPNR